MISTTSLPSCWLAFSRISSRARQKSPPCMRNGVSFCKFCKNKFLRFDVGAFLLGDVFITSNDASIDGTTRTRKELKNQFKTNNINWHMQNGVFQQNDGNKFLQCFLLIESYFCGKPKTIYSSYSVIRRTVFFKKFLISIKNYRQSLGASYRRIFSRNNFFLSQLLVRSSK